MGMGVVIGLFFVVIVFLTTTYFCARSWRWHHLTLLIFAFLGNVVLFGMSVAALKMRQSWMVIAQEQEEKLRERSHAIEIAESGGEMSKGDATLLGLENRIADGTDSLNYAGARDLTYWIQYRIADRGRAFYNCKPSVNAAAGTAVVEINMPKPDGAAGDGAAGDGAPADEAPADGEAPPAPKKVTHGILPNTIVYIFQSASFADGGRYVGQFQVTATDPQNNTVTVVANNPRGRANIGLGGDWTIYTKMPSDARDVFVQIDESGRVIVDENGRPISLSKEELSRWLSDEKLVDAVLIDGRPATQADFDKAVAEKSTNVDVQVTFLKAHSIKRPDNTEDQFLPGETAVLNALTASELMRDGTVDANSAKYYHVRPLTDFDIAFHGLSEDVRALSEEHAAILREIELKNKAIENIQMDIDYRKKEIAAVTHDRDRLKKDSGIRERHIAALEAQNTKLREDLRRVYDQIVQYARQITKIQLEGAKRFREKASETSPPAVSVRPAR